MFRVIIAGSRTFEDYNILKEYMDFLLRDIKTKEEIEIVSGQARGADALGERYALDRGYIVKQFPADWTRYARRAGIMRNEKMGDYADALVAFWDGKSRGTKHMIEYAKSKNLKVRVKLFQLRLD